MEHFVRNLLSSTPLKAFFEVGHQDLGGVTHFFPDDPDVINLSAESQIPQLPGIQAQKSRSGDDYLTVQYEKITALLIEAVKELKAEVDTLKARLDSQ